MSTSHFSQRDLLVTVVWVLVVLALLMGIAALDYQGQLVEKWSNSLLRVVLG